MRCPVKADTEGSNPFITAIGVFVSKTILSKTVLDAAASYRALNTLDNHTKPEIYIVGGYNAGLTHLLIHIIML